MPSPCLVVMLTEILNMKRVGQKTLLNISRVFLTEVFLTCSPIKRKLRLSTSETGQAFIMGY